MTKDDLLLKIEELEERVREYKDDAEYWKEEYDMKEEEVEELRGDISELKDELYEWENKETERQFPQINTIIKEMIFNEFLTVIDLVTPEEMSKFAEEIKKK